MKLNKNVKLLRFKHYYIHRDGDFVIALLCGDKKHGYTFAASHANPAAWLGTVNTLTRIVPNDGKWIDIDKATFKVAAALHIDGHVIKVPEANGLATPLISKMYRNSQ